MPALDTARLLTLADAAAEGAQRSASDAAATLRELRAWLEDDEHPAVIEACDAAVEARQWAAAAGECAEGVHEAAEAHDPHEAQRRVNLARQNAARAEQNCARVRALLAAERDSACAVRSGE